MQLECVLICPVRGAPARDNLVVGQTPPTAHAPIFGWLRRALSTRAGINRISIHHLDNHGTQVFLSLARRARSVVTLISGYLSQCAAVVVANPATPASLPARERARMDYFG